MNIYFMYVRRNIPGLSSISNLYSFISLFLYIPRHTRDLDGVGKVVLSSRRQEGIIYLFYHLTKKTTFKMKMVFYFLFLSLG